MQTINRLLVNIITDQLHKSASFYTRLFDFEIDYQSDWFIHLISKDNSREIGFINPDSDIVPKGLDEIHRGSYLTFVVDDVDAFYSILEAENIKVLRPPHDTFYGQRRMLLRDVNGLALDISSPLK